jgi:hypothetical protein
MVSRSNVSTVIVLGGLVTAVVLLIASRRAAPPPGLRSVTRDAGPPVELVVPRARSPIVLDGHITDDAWLHQAVRTRPFVEEDGRTQARPYSEARFLWGDGQLYIGLYASDEDIRATHERADDQVWRDDSFRLAFEDTEREYLFDVSALGVLADGVRGKRAATTTFDYAWSSGARITHELEGSPNQPDNNDEEWVIEMAIPLASLGLKGVAGERIGLWLSRCDTPKGQPRACSDWGRSNGRGMLVLE